MKQTERNISQCILALWIFFRGYSYGGELLWLGGLAGLGEMIFISRSQGMFYSVQSKSLLCPWKKIVWSNSFHNKQCGKANMQNKCSCIIQLTSENQSAKSSEISPRRAGQLASHMNALYFYKSFFKEGEISPRRASPPNRVINNCKC